MIDYAEAKRLAEAAINKNYTVRGDRLVVIDSSTIEKEYGWVFFYDSQKYLESDDETYLLAGNAPLVVQRDGSLHWLGTAKPVSEYLAEFDSQWRASRHSEG